MRTHPSFVMAAVAGCLLLSACGGEQDPGPADDIDTGATSEEPADDTTSDDAADTGSEADTGSDADTTTAADLAVATTDLGEVLVDGDGMTLYRFTNDPEGESVCEGDCATAWPPLVVEGEPEPGEGIDPGLVGTIERGDGATQVTYGGAPLYTWASDTQPGDVTGQGVNDVWFVVAPDGQAIMEAEDEGASGSSGY